MVVPGSYSFPATPPRTVASEVPTQFPHRIRVTGRSDVFYGRTWCFENLNFHQFDLSVYRDTKTGNYCGLFSFARPRDIDPFCQTVLARPWYWKMGLTETFDLIVGRFPVYK